MSLDRMIQRMAGLVATRHQDLVRGMLAECSAIPEDAARRRFALGVLFAVTRLALSTQVAGLLVDIGVRPPSPGDVLRFMPAPRQLLRRLAGPFLASSGVLTGLLVANFAVRAASQLNARPGGSGALVEVIAFAVPFTLAMTLPMGVFLAVAWVFTRLGQEGVVAEARRRRGGMRRLVAPIVAASAGLSILAVVSNTQVLPRANHRLRQHMSYQVDAATRTYKSDREMTVGELRAAATEARALPHPRARAEAEMYEVEIHKKFALAAASLVLALAAAAFGMWFPSAGPWLVGASGIVVFVGYYACLVAGETFVDRQAISPAIGMWLANAVLLVATLIALRRPRSRSG